MKSVWKPSAFVAHERDLRARLQAVHERELIVPGGVSRMFAWLPVTALKKAAALRRWFYVRSPRWLIASKRKIFGISKRQRGRPAALADGF